MGRLVSIIIPCHNSQEFVKEAIQSALDQTYKNIEIICIDDGSTDNTLEILNGFRPKVDVYSQPQGGPGKARNEGVKKSTGELIAFLDADDTLDKNFIREMVKFLDSSNNASYVYSKMRMEGKKKGISETIEFDPGFLIMRDNFIGIGILIPKSYFLDAGGFDESLKAFEDWDMWLKLLQKSRLGALFDKPLYIWHFRSEFSRNQDNLEAKRRFHLKLLVKNWRLVLKYGVPFCFRKIQKRLVPH